MCGRKCPICEALGIDLDKMQCEPVYVEQQFVPTLTDDEAYLLELEAKESPG
jgi:hypothetical protein